jgi:hypothetical protein
MQKREISDRLTIIAYLCEFMGTLSCGGIVADMTNNYQTI